MDQKLCELTRWSIQTNFLILLLQEPKKWGNVRKYIDVSDRYLVKLENFTFLPSKYFKKLLRDRLVC